MNDKFYMKQAINKAWEVSNSNPSNPAVGAVVVDKITKFLSIEAHKKAGFLHAEANAIKSALEKLNPNLIFPQNKR